MRYYILTLLFFISLILQSTLFARLTVAGMKPDLVLVFVIIFALLRGSGEGAAAGFIGGLLQDLMFGQNIGMNTLSKMVTGYAVGVLERKIYKENLLIPLGVLFAGTFLNETFLYFLRFVSQGSGTAGAYAEGYFAFVRSVIFPTAVYNCCLVPFIYGRFYKSSQKGLLKKVDS